MKNILLLCCTMVFSLGAHAQAPALGSYSNITLTSGGNASITPSVIPANTVKAMAYSNSNFKGILSVNPSTGVLKITNAKNAGVYPITIKAYNAGSLTATTTCTLTVTNPLCSQGQFYSSVTPEISVGSLPQNIEIADFNNDGIQDFITANYFSSNVSISLGNGSGGFNTASALAIPGSLADIAIADFNRDGNLDFAVSDYDDYAGIDIYLGNGLGGFTFKSTMGYARKSISLASGDFNEDGFIDIIETDFHLNSITIFTGDGLGNFSVAGSFYGGSSPQDICVGDFNEDSHLDAVVSNSGSNNVSVFLGNGAVNFPSITTYPAAGVGNSSIEVGDFNNDGHQDFARTAYTSGLGLGNGSIGLGNGLGGFSILPPATLDGLFSIKTGDFNGDGNQDLITSGNYNTTHINIGNGLGSFTQAPVVSNGLYPRAVVVGDFNQDQRMDFLEANSMDNNVSVRLGGVNEINVKGSGVSISDGDNSASAADGTDFGIVPIYTALTHSFSIENTGTTPLLIPASGMTFTGVNASLYSISGITLPISIAAGGSANFNITFAPTEGGDLPTSLHITNDDCNESDYDFAINGKSNPRLRLTAYLQGYYVTGMSQLAPVLNNQGNMTALASDADDVTIELYKYDLPFTHTLHLAQTTRMNIAGQATITLSYSELGKTYYMALSHRNSIRTFAAVPITITGFTSHKFTSDAAMAFGNNQIEVDPGVFAIYTGDINQDGYIDGFDYPIYDVDAQNNVSGVYVSTDLNGDGYVDGFDYPIFDLNSQNNVVSISP